jgi:hypothetical protein
MRCERVEIKVVFVQRLQRGERTRVERAGE